MMRRRKRNAAVIMKAVRYSITGGSSVETMPSRANQRRDNGRGSDVAVESCSNIKFLSCRRGNSNLQRLKILWGRFAVLPCSIRLSRCAGVKREPCRGSARGEFTHSAQGLHQLPPVHQLTKDPPHNPAVSGPIGAYPAMGCHALLLNHSDGVPYTPAPAP